MISYSQKGTRKDKYKKVNPLYMWFCLVPLHMRMSAVYVTLSCYFVYMPLCCDLFWLFTTLAKFVFYATFGNLICNHSPKFQVWNGLNWVGFETLVYAEPKPIFFNTPFPRPQNQKKNGHLHPCFGSYSYVSSLRACECDSRMCAHVGVITWHLNFVFYWTHQQVSWFFK